MRTWNGTHDRIHEGDVVSPKLDGIYAKATKAGLTTKSGNPITTQPGLQRRLKLHFLLHPKSQLEGELYRDGEPLQKIVSDFKTGKQLPFHIFPGKGARPLPVLGIKNVKATTVHNAGEANAAYDGAIKAGYEGQIIQRDGKESLKRKPMHDSEYKIIGGKVGKKHGILTVTDGKRSFRVQAPAEIAGNAPVGKKATIGYFRKTLSGKPHAPVFKAVRDYDMAANGMRIEFGPFAKKVMSALNGMDKGMITQQGLGLGGKTGDAVIGKLDNVNAGIARKFAGPSVTFAVPAQPKKPMNPYVKAGISGGISGAVLGALPILKNGVSVKTALKGAAGIGAASAAIVGGGGWLGSKIIGDPKKDEALPFTKRAAIGGAIVGTGVGALGVLAAKKIPFIRTGLEGMAKEWRPAKWISKAGPVGATSMATVAGGVVGAHQAADEGMQVDSINSIQQARDKRKQFSVRGKLITFLVQEEGGVPLTGKIAKDRFIKKLRDTDLDRRDANIGRGMGAGAVAGLVAGGVPSMSKLGLITRVGIGAGTGGLGVLAVRAATNHTKDIYGERSRGAKQAEKIPMVAGLAGAAGLGYVGLKHRYKFSVGGRVIQFDSRRDPEERVRDRMEISKNVALTGAGATAIGGAGYLAYKGKQGIDKLAARGQAILSPKNVKKVTGDVKRTFKNINDTADRIGSTADDLLNTSKEGTALIHDTMRTNRDARRAVRGVRGIVNVGIKRNMIQKPWRAIKRVANIKIFASGERCIIFEKRDVENAAVVTGGAGAGALAGGIYHAKKLPGRPYIPGEDLTGKGHCPQDSLCSPRPPLCHRS